MFILDSSEQPVILSAKFDTNKTNENLNSMIGKNAQ